MRLFNGDVHIKYSKPTLLKGIKQEDTKVSFLL
jgi:hypothetical protein